MKALKQLLPPTPDPEMAAALLAEDLTQPDNAKCSKCGDAGFLRRAVPLGHPDFGKVFPCDCERETPGQTVARLVRWSGVPKTTRQTHRFGTWRAVQGLAPAFTYARLFANAKAPHPFLTFAGPPGTGKTHLAIAIAWDWLEAQRTTVSYCQSEALLDALRRGYDHDLNCPDDSTYQILHFTTRCSLLVLDDLGAEKATDWSTAKLDEIIDHRYIQRLPTVFTLNVAPDQLPPRLADRLMEGKVFVLNAPSYRRRQRKEKP